MISFFIWTHKEDKLETFLEHVNGFDPSIKFIHESSKERLPFLYLKVILSNEKLLLTFLLKIQIDISIYTIHHFIQTILNGLLCIAKH